MTHTTPLSCLRAGAVCALLVGAMPAAAQSGGATPAVPADATVAPAMSMPQLIEHLTKLGFSDFKEVERKSDKLFEVKARDAQRVRVELMVDARSGEVLKSKRDD